MAFLAFSHLIAKEALKYVDSVRIFLFFLTHISKIIVSVKRTTFSHQKTHIILKDVGFSCLGVYFLAEAKYSFVNLITTGLNSAIEIKLGIAINPFNVSATAQASLSSTVPAIQANKQKIT